MVITMKDNMKQHSKSAVDNKLKHTADNKQQRVQREIQETKLNKRAPSHNLALDLDRVQLVNPIEAV